MSFIADTRPELLDLQGKAVLLALDPVNEVRIGRHITLLKADNETIAREKIEEACSKLLANLTMELYTFDLQQQ